MSTQAESTGPRPADATGAVRAESGAPGRDDDSPFGAPSAGRRWALRWVLSATVLLAVILAVFLATRRSGQPAETAGHDHGAAAAADSAKPVMLSADEARRIGVTYAAATRGPMTREIRTVGQVTFDETRVKAISPKVDGWVERLYVDFTGQSVRAGAPLLAIYSPMLVTAQEELLLAKRLEADVAGGSEDARRSAAELLSSARRRLAYWDIPASDVTRIERAGEVQRTLTLRAPVSGFVVEKNVVEGQRIMAGEGLYRLADLSTVWVEGDVFEQDLPSVRLGLPVSATFSALPAEEFRGRITYVYPTLNAETRTAKVRVELANSGLRLKPGMYATLHLAGAARPDAITVPRSAVLATGERSLVFVRRPDGMLEPRVVAIGGANDERIEILRGLAAGETVVASATFLIDAESNLGAVMGGMGDMPGMDMTAPTKVDVPATRPSAPPPAPQKPSREAPSATPNMPGMRNTPGVDHSSHEE